jgi:hypothetical protein
MPLIALALVPDCIYAALEQVSARRAQLDSRTWRIPRYAFDYGRDGWETG